jgi:hypothetical protein
MAAGWTVALAEGSGLVGGLRLGTATGAATAIVSGTQLCHPGDVDRLLPLVTARFLRAVALHTDGSIVDQLRAWLDTI